MENMNWHEINAEIQAQLAIATAAEGRVRELKTAREKLEAASIAKGGRPHPCCNVAGNLEITEKSGRVTGMFKGQSVQGDKVVRTCKACGAKHHEVSLDPIEIKASGKGTQP